MDALLIIKVIIVSVYNIFLQMATRRWTLKINYTILALYVPRHF